VNLDNSALAAVVARAVQVEVARSRDARLKRQMAPSFQLLAELVVGPRRVLPVAAGLVGSVACRGRPLSISTDPLGPELRPQTNQAQALTLSKPSTLRKAS
jgi:hypothetical protein